MSDIIKANAIESIYIFVQHTNNKVVIIDFRHCPRYYYYYKFKTLGSKDPEG